MSTQVSGADAEIRALYQRLLESWNSRSARDMAALFTDDCNVIGFDGSPMNGRTEVETSISQIFADHPTSAYVGKVREVRFLTPDVAVLRAVSGMVPPGQSDLNPNVNTMQTLVAVKHDDGWRIAVYQNTPAAFHGRPDMSQALTEELRELL
jgi:uncharacterized protein (TIGR02246 family)